MNGVSEKVQSEQNEACLAETGSTTKKPVETTSLVDVSTDSNQPGYSNNEPIVIHRMSPPRSHPLPLSQKQQRVCNIIILCTTFCFSIGSLFFALPVDRHGYSNIGQFFMPLVKLIDE